MWQYDPRRGARPQESLDSAQREEPQPAVEEDSSRFQVRPGPSFWLWVERRSPNEAWFPSSGSGANAGLRRQRSGLVSGAVEPESSHVLAPPGLGVWPWVDRSQNQTRFPSIGPDANGGLRRQRSGLVSYGREEFNSLFESTHDPERKLKLWGEQHKSEVANDAKAERETTKDEGWLFGRNAEQERNRRLNMRRDEIVKSTDHEVDDELKFLLDKQAKGTLTEQDVLDLKARREHEHKIEMKYNVNLTNKDGTRKDGTKIAWSDAELNDVESALARMPEGHVKDNTLLKEIKRSDQSVREKDPNNPRIGGDHSRGVISIYDRGTIGKYRHTGDTHELADPSLRGVDGQPLSKTGDRIGSLAETLPHEFGHDIHDLNPDAFKRYQQAVGWQQDVGDSQMANAGISAADIAAIKARTQTNVKGSDGKVYKTDPYNKNQVLAVDDGAIPEPGTGATPNSATGGDTWDYARTNYKDNFAEHYAKAINVPEKLAKDLIDAPATRVSNERTNRDTAQAGRDAAQAGLDAAKSKKPLDRREVDDQQAQLEAANKRLETANKRLEAANKNQTAQKTQYDILRNDIFHADRASDAAAKRLADKGVDPAKIAEFRAKAARAQTPQQVDLIASGY